MWPFILFCLSDFSRLNRLLIPSVAGGKMLRWEDDKAFLQAKVC